MQLGKRSWMACWRESGDIQLPNCPLTPSFPLGTASWRFEVTTKVRLSTRATSTGSVRANQLQIYNDVRENDKREKKREMNRITQKHDTIQVSVAILRFYQSASLYIQQCTVPVFHLGQGFEHALLLHQTNQGFVFSLGSIADMNLAWLTKTCAFFDVITNLNLKRTLNNIESLHVWHSLILPSWKVLRLGRWRRHSRTGEFYYLHSFLKGSPQNQN